ncbi:MAG: hypothetical protein Q8O37_16645 [Sulfuricellaceae bacterium]|nr:hypothetical protein [Sulfuricellaceae bacterium]
MQLDLFLHGREVILRNDALAAIQERHVQDGRAALAKLAAEYPGDTHLAALETLLHILEYPPRRCTSPDAVLVAKGHLESIVQAVAERLMSPTQARSWIAGEWEILAEAAAGLAYTPTAPPAYAAPLYLKAGAWAAAEAAVQAIPSWRRIPLPLAWMAEARLAQFGMADAWPLLIELAWLDPAGFDTLVRRLKEPILEHLLRNFDADFENETGDEQDSHIPPGAWLPAWCLIVEPGLAPLLRQTQPGQGQNPERAARLLLDMLALEKRGTQPRLLEQRKALRQLHPGLFARYMLTR